jgi:hypothetical protein
MLERYECGFRVLRNGVMKALRLKPVHAIKESPWYGVTEDA